MYSQDICKRGLIFATFHKSHECTTQYSGIGNSARAMRLAEDALRRGTACGKVYNIVDGGPPVGTFSFWFPLIRALNKPLPIFKIPYILIIFLAILFENLYRYFGLEPFFTRLEVNLMSITNTYSIEQAQHDLGYEPIQNHDLSEVINYYKIVDNESRTKNKRFLMPVISSKKSRLIVLNSTSFILLMLMVFFFWLVVHHF
ncbi:unnamed protein product [Onchocerca ochengi]|uniref:3Beta_HSD domain-containing protein n=1 Tax=Onchocerca ochengi TaxID=42157 RepID=A0A182ELD9_ONCOC|nr:unnamed protein product [Onchocerca ochengi]